MTAQPVMVYEDYHLWDNPVDALTFSDLFQDRLLDDGTRDARGVDEPFVVLSAATHSGVRVAAS
jgi:hypothetical protein